MKDSRFCLLIQISAGKWYLERTSNYQAFTCGLIKDSLSNLGIKSIVTAEVSSKPACEKKERKGRKEGGREGVFFGWY
jgi:hypothetical protein